MELKCRLPVRRPIEIRIFKMSSNLLASLTTAGPMAFALIKEIDRFKTVDALYRGGICQQTRKRVQPQRVIIYSDYFQLSPLITNIRRGERESR